MTCTECQTKQTYNMKCIKCAARHCKMMFYPDPKLKLAYVKAISEKYGHNAESLLNCIKMLAIK